MFNRKIHMLKLLGLAIVGLSLLACESTPRVHSVYEQGANFSQYKTYGFLESMEPKGEEYTTIHDKYLREAIVRELESRGLSPAKEPDLLVGFHVKTKEKVESRVSPSVKLGYYGYRGIYGYSYGVGYGTETRVRSYTEGTLNIDLVDRERKQLVWEGVAIGRLKEKPPENWQEKVNEVVANVFSEYPIQNVAQ